MTKPELPQDWSTVSLEDYLEYVEIDLNTDYGHTTKSIEKLCLLSNDDGWDDAEISDIVKAVKTNPWINLPPSSNYSKVVGKYTHKPNTQLTLGEWIDMEKYILDRKYGCLVALLYKQTSTDKWGNVEYEPHSYSCTSRQSEFMDMAVTEVYGAIDEAISYRDTLLTAYKDIFSHLEDENEVGTDDEDKEFLTQTEINELKNTIKKENQLKSLGWQKMLDEICSGNWTYISGILDLPVVFVFNMMLTKKMYSDSGND